MKKLLGLTLAQLTDVAAEVGLRPFAARQMAAWLYQKRVTNLDAMTDLPKRARAELADKGYIVGRTEPL
ncbi:MAG: 23S rRNA (adenine(2503)-C(2))-methyltransferase RlmN, partial [Muribaculaceae bacterium]|nr:23S rRNA (adenine(2503)-C(2))-methyltransferase RlmN [Muribaculaceae bacterium]